MISVDAELPTPAGGFVCVSQLKETVGRRIGADSALVLLILLQTEEGGREQTLLLQTGGSWTSKPASLSSICLTRPSVRPNLISYASA